LKNNIPFLDFAWDMFAPPSLAALPPIPKIRRLHPECNAETTNWSVWQVVVFMCFRVWAGTSANPDAAAISKTAVSPFPSRHVNPFA